jgi:hypothetical protein
MSVVRDYVENYGDMLEENVDFEIYNVCIDLYGTDGKPTKHFKKHYKNLKNNEKFRDIIKERLIKEIMQ